MLAHELLEILHATKQTWRYRCVAIARRCINQRQRMFGAAENLPELDIEKIAARVLVCIDVVQLLPQS